MLNMIPLSSTYMLHKNDLHLRFSIWNAGIWNIKRLWNWIQSGCQINWEKPAQCKPKPSFHEFILGLLNEMRVNERDKEHMRRYKWINAGHAIHAECVSLLPFQCERLGLVLLLLAIFLLKWNTQLSSFTLCTCLMVWVPRIYSSYQSTHCAFFSTSWDSSFFHKQNCLRLLHTWRYMWFWNPHRNEH